MHMKASVHTEIVAVLVYLGLYWVCWSKCHVDVALLKHLTARVALATLVIWPKASCLIPGVNMSIWPGIAVRTKGCRL